MLQLWAGALANGVLMGVVYALVALGLTVLFGVMRVVNFAHGQMVVTGMYLGYVCSERFGLSVLPAAAGTAVAMFGFGYVLQRCLVQGFISRPQHAQFILFIGVALALTGLQLVVFGPDAQTAFSAASFDVIAVGPLSLDRSRVEAAGAAAVIMAGLVALLRFSPLGRAMRAAADNPLGGAVVGLNIPRIYALTSGLAAACAGAAGALVAPIFDTQPFLATDFTLVAFVIVIVGGLGSLAGAMLGGILIGVGETLAALLVDPALKTAFSYLLLVGVLLVRPAGLFRARFA